jgi:hypothetical protein
MQEPTPAIVVKAWMWRELQHPSFDRSSHCVPAVMEKTLDGPLPRHANSPERGSAIVLKILEIALPRWG